MAQLEGGGCSCSPFGCPAPLALASWPLPVAVIFTPRSPGEGPGHSRSQEEGPRAPAEAGRHPGPTVVLLEGGSCSHSGVPLHCPGSPAAAGGGDPRGQEPRRGPKTEPEPGQDPGPRPGPGGSRAHHGPAEGRRVPRKKKRKIYHFQKMRHNINSTRRFTDPFSERWYRQHDPTKERTIEAQTERNRKAETVDRGHRAHMKRGALFLLPKDPGPTVVLRRMCPNRAHSKPGPHVAPMEGGSCSRSAPLSWLPAAGGGDPRGQGPGERPRTEPEPGQDPGPRPGPGGSRAYRGPTGGRQLLPIRVSRSIILAPRLLPVAAILAARSPGEGPGRSRSQGKDPAPRTEPGGSRGPQWPRWRAAGLPFGCPAPLKTVVMMVTRASGRMYV